MCVRVCAGMDHELLSSGERVVRPRVRAAQIRCHCGGLRTQAGEEGRREGGVRKGRAEGERVTEGEAEGERGRASEGGRNRVREGWSESDIMGEGELLSHRRRAGPATSSWTDPTFAFSPSGAVSSRWRPCSRTGHLEM